MRIDSQVNGMRGMITESEDKDNMESFNMTLLPSSLTPPLLSLVEYKGGGIVMRSKECFVH